MGNLIRFAILATFLMGVSGCFENFKYVKHGRGAEAISLYEDFERGGGN